MECNGAVIEKHCSRLCKGSDQVGALNIIWLSGSGQVQVELSHYSELGLYWNGNMQRDSYSSPNL